MITDITPFTEIYSVSQLNREVRELLETGFPLLWLEGEISNFKRPSSGHCYFSLKDAAAQVRCAMFRMRSSLLNFTPQDGMHVLVRARVSLYEDRGDFQLIIEHMEETGSGALRRAFEALKKRLADEGLFDATGKKSLPSFPTRIGVVTSPTGAAIRDILTVLKRRAPHISVIIYPTQVQGADAAPQIVAALNYANQRNECDILMVARGGGSLEDLWPFNEEIVARAIYASTIPIISGVGHEIDFTIADFVADHRAATPSAAAELASPNQQDWLQKLEILKNRLKHFVAVELRHFNTLLNSLHKQLQHPGKRILDQAQRLDYLERNLIKAGFNLLSHKQADLNQHSSKLQRYQPQQYLQELMTLHLYSMVTLRAK